MSEDTLNGQEEVMRYGVERTNNSIPGMPSTYLNIGNDQDGKLEVDLVQFREKNVSMRYLSFTFSGINPKTGDIQSAFINVDNKEAFNVIKNFFTQLDWDN